MAKSAVKNPRFYSGPPLEKDTKRAADSITWKAGQPGYFDTDGLCAVLATDGVNASFIFSSDQDTATSSSDVKIERILNASTRFVGFISQDDADTVAAATQVGDQYGIHVGSNVATVNVNETSNVAVMVDALLYQEEGYMNASTDDPGQVIFHYIQSVLDL